jgi:AraC-like DNA-binding protein
MRVFSELEELSPLLERARYGVEFFGMGDTIRELFNRIKQSHGLTRFVAFAEMLCQLQRCEDYRLLSSTPMDSILAGEVRSTINAIVEFVSERYAEPLSVADAAAWVNMTESRFSRYFNKATDSTFSSFVNRVRIQKACELLMHSESQISSICYAVGFNNIANFNRRFREIKGMAPKQFRAQRAERLGRPAATSANIGVAPH